MKKLEKLTLKELGENYPKLTQEETSILCGGSGLDYREVNGACEISFDGGQTWMACIGEVTVTGNDLSSCTFSSLDELIASYESTSELSWIADAGTTISAVGILVKNTWAGVLGTVMSVAEMLQRFDNQNIINQLSTLPEGNYYVEESYMTSYGPGDYGTTLTVYNEEGDYVKTIAY